MLPLCIGVFVSSVFFLICDRYEFDFLVFVENDKLKFRVENGVGTAQLYRKQLACADAPSPIAGGDHVWRSLRDMCDSAIQQSKDGDESRAAVSKDANNFTV